MWILSAVTALQGDPWETLVVILKHFLVHIYNQKHKLLVWETQILSRDDIISQEVIVRIFLDISPDMRT